MKRLVMLTLLGGICLIAFAGCKAEEPPPPPPPAPPPPPPPPTPEEIENEVLATFQAKYKILYSLVSGKAEEQKEEQQKPRLGRRGRGGRLGQRQNQPTPQDIKESIKADLIKAKNTHSNTDYGRKGLQRVANLFERDIEKAYKQGQSNRKMYDVVFMACDLLEVLEPDNPMLERYRQLTKDQLNRPIVKVTGNTTMDDGKTVWFFQVTLPETGTTESVRAQEGDEFLGLRFVRTLGSNRAVELEYLKLHERFIVQAP